MPDLNFISFPQLITSRLLLRQLMPDDRRDIFLLRSDELVNKFLDRPATTSIEEADKFIQKINENKSMYWAICLKEPAELVGTICYWNMDDANGSVEIGYELKPACQGKGLMQEAMAAVISFGWQTMALRKITAFTHHENKRSLQLLKKFNFSRDEALEQASVDKTSDHVIYSLSGDTQ